MSRWTHLHSDPDKAQTLRKTVALVMGKVRPSAHFERGDVETKVALRVWSAGQRWRPEHSRLAFFTYAAIEGRFGRAEARRLHGTLSRRQLDKIGAGESLPPAQQTPVWIETPVHTDDADGETVGSLMAAPDDVEALVFERLAALALRRYVDLLPGRERHVIAGCFFRGLLLSEIGVELGLCEARVSMIKADGLARLRGYLEHEEQAD